MAINNGDSSPTMFILVPAGNQPTTNFEVKVEVVYPAVYPRLLLHRKHFSQQFLSYCDMSSGLLPSDGPWVCLYRHVFAGHLIATVASSGSTVLAFIEYVMIS
jgi:hypothetical protein